MATLTPDRARELLGGTNGHDVLGGHSNQRGTILVTQPRHFWLRLFGGGTRHREIPQRRSGMRLIGTGAVLLILLGAGLLAVSYAAQYRYVLGERHQHIASLIEAGALDVGMIIFSLIALGLALAGLASKTERAAIIACAVASAVMNYAAADLTSARSVLAFCMPPVFLAFVVDRVVSAARRHVLGIRGRSPWSAAGLAAARVARLAGMAVLYGLRFVLAPPSTAAGVRRAVLAATPVPGPTARPALAVPQHPRPAPDPHAADARHQRQPRTAGRAVTKTALLLERVTARYGVLTLIQPEQVAQIATAIAPEVDLHPASARTALLKAVRAAHAEGDGK
jgi:hypothetical protein